MNKLLISFIVGGVMLSTCPVAIAANPWVTLNKVSIESNTITVHLTGAPKYHSFTVSNPARVVVEFADTLNDCRQKEIMVTGDLIKRIRIGQFKNDPLKISRVVIDVTKLGEFEVKSVGNTVLILFKTDAEQTIAVPENKVITEKSAEVPKSKAQPIAKDPGYEQATAVAAQTKTIPTVYAEPVSTSVPFALSTTPASTVKKVSPIKETPQTTTAIKTQSAEQSSLKTVLSKKLITFDFEEADIRDVFRILAVKSGINIIYGPDVAGTLSLRLDNVAFDKAFSTILAIKGLVSIDEGPGILRVVTTQKLSEERAQAVTFTKIFPLNYAKADEIKSNLDSIRSAEGRRGSISVDPRTNSLIVTDTPEGFISLTAIIGELDRKPAQVIIEAKIVEVVLNKSLDMGIQWQYANTVKNDSNIQIYNGGSQAATSNNAQGPNAVQGANIVTPLSTIQGGTGVTFPASAVSGQISSIAFGLVANETRLTGILTALAQKGLSKLLSSPKVTTINNQEAKIMVGQKIPYTTTTVSVSGTTQQTNFLDVGIKLTVTPTINSDQKITLNVHPEVSLYVRSDPAGPVIGTREAITTVIVNNGETVVIGGLITDEDRKSATMVPLLGDLPIIGHLFRQDIKSKDRTELLVFITPQIINN